MKKEFFVNIQNRVKTRMPEINHFDLYAGQFNDELLTQKILFFPCVLLEFRQMDFQTLSENVQQCDALIVVHIAQNMIATDFYEGAENQNQALTMLDFTEEVHKALQGFTDDFFTPLTRVREVQNSNFGNVFVNELHYQTTINDISTWNGNNDTDKNATLDLQMDLDIKNFIIRT